MSHRISGSGTCGTLCNSGMCVWCRAFDHPECWSKGVHDVKNVSRVYNHRTVWSNWNVSPMLSNVWANVSQRSASARSRRSLHAFFVTCMHTASVPLPPNASDGNNGNNGRVAPKVQCAPSAPRRNSSVSKKPRPTCWTNAWTSSSNSGTRLKRSFAKPSSATEHCITADVSRPLGDPESASCRGRATSFQPQCSLLGHQRSAFPSAEAAQVAASRRRFGGRPVHCMAQEVLHQLFLAVCMAFMIHHQSAGESAHFVEERGESSAGIACSRTSFLENASRAPLQESQGIQDFDNPLNVSKPHRVAELGLLPVVPGRRGHGDNYMLKSRRARTTVVYWHHKNFNFKAKGLRNETSKIAKETRNSCILNFTQT